MAHISTFNGINAVEIRFILKGFSSSALLYNFLIDSIEELNLSLKEVQKYSIYKISKVDNNKRVSLVKMFFLWKAIEKVANRSDIGLIIADLFTPQKAGIIGKLFFSSKNLKESIFIINRFLSILIDIISMEYTEIGDESVFYFEISPQFIIPHSVVECYIKICYNWVKEYLKEEKIEIKEIGYIASGVKHLNFYKKSFPKTTLLFNRDKNYVILDKSIFYIENRDQVDSSYEILMKYAKKVQDEINSYSTFYQKVANQIVLHLADGHNNLEKVASSLDMSQSTIKRKLKEENTSFKKIVQNIRKNLSICMIKDKDLTLEEISCFLGYSEYSPFFRAFKKWHNISPSEYRKKLFDSDIL